MIVGRVTDRPEAVLPLRIPRPNGRCDTIEFVIDTGFSGELSLPRAQIAALALNRVDVVPVTLADGSQVLVPVFEATIEWGRRSRGVTVLALESDPLAGIQLLVDHTLRVEVVDGGRVTIRKLSNRKPGPGTPSGPARP